MVVNIITWDDSSILQLINFYSILCVNGNVDFYANFFRQGRVMNVAYGRGSRIDSLQVSATHSIDHYLNTSQSIHSQNLTNHFARNAEAYGIVQERGMQGILPLWSSYIVLSLLFCCDDLSIATISKFYCCTFLVWLLYSNFFYRKRLNYCLQVLTTTTQTVTDCKNCWYR